MGACCRRMLEMPISAALSSYSLPPTEPACRPGMQGPGSSDHGFCNQACTNGCKAHLCVAAEHKSLPGQHIPLVPCEAHEESSNTLSLSSTLHQAGASSAVCLCLLWSRSLCSCHLSVLLVHEGAKVHTHIWLILLCCKSCQHPGSAQRNSITMGQC